MEMLGRSRFLSADRSFSCGSLLERELTSSVRAEAVATVVVVPETRPSRAETVMANETSPIGPKPIRVVSAVPAPVARPSSTEAMRMRRREVVIDEFPSSLAVFLRTGEGSPAISW